METINKKECPKCGSKNIFETRSGVGTDKGKGSYSLEQLSEIFCECRDCGEKFSFKK